MENKEEWFDGVDSVSRTNINLRAEPLRRPYQTTFDKKSGLYNYIDPVKERLDHFIELIQIVVGRHYGDFFSVDELNMGWATYSRNPTGKEALQRAYAIYVQHMRDQSGIRAHLRKNEWRDVSSYPPGKDFYPARMSVKDFEESLAEAQRIKFQEETANTLKE